MDAFLDLTYVVMQLEGARATQRSCTVHLQTVADNNTPQRHHRYTVRLTL